MRILFFLAAMLSLCAAARGEEALLRVASVQMEVKNDWRENLTRILKGIDDAKVAGARIVLFPETSLSGFSKEAVASLTWGELEAGMQRVAEAAKANEVYVLYGCATKSHAEKPFNSVIVVGPDGVEITRYHKMFPEAYFEPGDHLALFSIDEIPCTLMICHDERFPELTRIPVLAGARVCFYLSYEINTLEGAHKKKDGYRAQIIARAVENGVWVAQCNGVGPLAPDATSVSLGNSQVVAPDGSVVSTAPEMKEAMIVAEIRPAEARRRNALETSTNPALEAWWRAGMDLLLPTPPAK